VQILVSDIAAANVQSSCAHRFTLEFGFTRTKDTSDILAPSRLSYMSTIPGIIFIRVRGSTLLRRTIGQSSHSRAVMRWMEN
jgi:hypothetical protein